MKSSDIAITIGKRLRARRLQLGYSQDATSEKANLHPTYIGQVERGEKNATLESIQKICNALELPMDELFANIVSITSERRPAQKCYDLITDLPVADQEKMLTVVEEIISFKNG